ncbi:MAG TPA: DUF4339 domain-containing protein [Chthoniobacterales bacterium]|nr:DUF4339 domain-containing protein [Chthoniobacterales bacterium]
MAEQWIIRVQGKDYGPTDLETLREWKADGRVLAANQARRADLEHWQTAAEIPGLFRAEPPPVQRGVEARGSRAEFSGASAADAAAATLSKPPRRNLLIETFRIYFRGFFKFLGLSLLSIVPIVCAELTSRFIYTAPGVNVDLRTLVAGAFGLCMIVLRLVLLPVYVAGIQILSAELATGQRIGFLSVLNGAVKYWPRVAGLSIFVYVIFVLLSAFGIFVVFMVYAAGLAASVFFSVVALSLAVLQIWLFCRFFAFVLFWQQFAVLENLPAYHALGESNRLAHSGRSLVWYRRPLWRGALIVSLWAALLITIATFVLWPKIAAEWPLFRDLLNQLPGAQDPQALVQKTIASLPKEQPATFSEIGFGVLQRILQPLLGIAFVVLYLDSKPDAE